MTKRRLEVNSGLAPDKGVARSIVTNTNAGGGSVSQVGPSPGKQMADALAGFMPGAMALTRMKQEKKDKKSVMAGKIAALRGDALDPNADKLHARAYKATTEKNRMTEWATSMESFIESEDGAKLTAEEFDNHLLEQFDAGLEMRQGDEDSTNLFVAAMDDLHGRFVAKHNEAHSTYKYNQALAARADTIVADLKAYQALPADEKAEGKGELYASLKGKGKLALYASLDDAYDVGGSGKSLMGISQEDQDSILTQIVEAEAAEGRGDLLEYCEDRGMLEHGKNAKKLRAAKAKYEEAQRLQHSADKLDYLANLEQMVVDGTFKRAHADDAIAKFPEQWRDPDATMAKLLARSARNAASAKEGEVNIAAWVRGEYGVFKSEKERQAAATGGIAAIKQRYPVDPQADPQTRAMQLEKQHDAIVDCWNRSGFAVKGLKLTVGAALSHLPEGDPKQQWMDQYDLWRKMHETNPGLAALQVGEKVDMDMQIIDDLVMAGGHDMKEAIALRRMQKEAQIPEGHYSRELREQVQEAADELIDGGWFGDDAVFTGRLKADLHKLAQVYTGSGYAATPELAAQKALEVMKARHDNVRGELLPNGGVPLKYRAKIAGDKSFGDAFDHFVEANPDMIKASFAGISAGDINLDEVRPMLTPAGDAVVFKYSHGGQTAMGSVPIPLEVIGDLMNGETERELEEHRANLKQEEQEALEKVEGRKKKRIAAFWMEYSGTDISDDPTGFHVNRFDWISPEVAATLTDDRILEIYDAAEKNRRNRAKAVLRQIGEVLSGQHVDVQPVIKTAGPRGGGWTPKQQKLVAERMQAIYGN